MACPADPPKSGNPSPEIEVNPSSESSPPSINSADLLHGHRELLIHHEGEIYRLRLTRTGKLILNK
jgi:hemin uptake protein HemP